MEIYIMDSVEHDFPKTHDLEHLLSLCAKHDKTFKELEEFAISITDYAVETRYVDEWREISSEESVGAIESAQKIYVIFNSL
jgi:HEPN domain-containing protein